MSMNKKISCFLLIFIIFTFCKVDVHAIASSTTWDSSTEELIYSYEASVAGIRRVWLECTGANINTTITLYAGDYTKEKITGRKSTSDLRNGTYSCQAHVQTRSNNDNRESAGDVTFTKKNATVSDNGTNGGSGAGSDVATGKACDSITIEEECTRNACKWNKNKTACEDLYVAQNPCDENSMKKVLRFFGYLLMIAKVCIPLLIIGFGTYDLFKSVIDKDEKSLNKQLKVLGVRLFAGLFVFFIPNLVYAVFGLSEKLNLIEQDKYKTCVSCLLDPSNATSCSVSED